MAKDSNGERDQHTRPPPREIKLRTGSGNEPVDYVCEIRADGSKRIEADGMEHVRFCTVACQCIPSMYSEPVQDEGAYRAL